MLLADEDRSRQQVIGTNLRKWYDAVTEEPVPGEWLEILNRSDDSGHGDHVRQKGSVERL